MEQEYDVIVLGTGLKECILSGLMSTAKKKVLHMDRNSYYGGESASLNLEQLYQRFKGEEKPSKDLGRTRDYCVDLCPKYLMACGSLVKVLLHTKVTKYLEFKSIKGSYVFSKAQDNKVHKVPSSPREALDSSLMGLRQKNSYKNFLQWVYTYDAADAKTHKYDKGMILSDVVKIDLTKMTSKELFAVFGLDENTVDFTGHAAALYQSDEYLNLPAVDLVERVKLYANSVQRYGNSPYIYPIWGLGGLPEGFSRLCAIHGGTYMLNKPIEEILYDAEGKVRGVKSEGQDAYCKQLIADPSYFYGTDKIKKTGQIARCIAILNQPIPNTNSDSAQIIVPAKQIEDGKKRKKDIYICMVSFLHKVVPDGKYVAVMSAEVEGKEIPALEKDAKGCEAGCRSELGFALKLLPQGAKDVSQTFFWVTDYYSPSGDGKKDNIFISSSYDATTHFESASREVLRLYEGLMGKKLDLTIPVDPDREEEPEPEEEGEGKEEKKKAGGGGGGGGGGGDAPAAPAASGDMSAAEVEAALAKELAKDKPAEGGAAAGGGDAS